MRSVKFDGVTKVFDGTVAVDDLSLDVAEGEFLVLLGPSGCGKSTALRMLAGLETPTAGTISIGDEVVNEIDPRHRDVAMVFQSYALYPHLTVAKNIESPLVGRKAEHSTKASRAEQVERVATMLGLGDLLDRKPAQLSGGQRQRVALARAIVRRPAVFCMDEPLSNLDAKLRTQTRADLVELHRDLSATFVYVTHDQIEAMTMASRIAIIDGGRLQQIGAPRDVYERPANVFVARFIGSPPMNVVDGAISSSGSAIEIAGGAIPIDGIFGEAGGRIQVGIRAEHVQLATSGVQATAGIAEWLGHEQVLHVDAGGSPLLVRIDAEAVVPEPGTSIAITAAPDHVHLFDADTGARLEATA